ncbi:MAG: iron-only hydrogenase system regulator [Clostridium sp.]|nr:iron-only hydrogenase system regulator [Clostridium sp.]MCM1387377.1 iron-only hydrogenase system regulator [Bacillus sp. (in: firmicutes)]MCM1427209.1 iron-only hydrogenase system regulator [Eubacterium sp.]
METRVAMLGIIIEDMEEVERLNRILHDYAEYIIGRMGIPYNKKKMHVISIVMDAPENQISALSGKIGMLKGMTSKVIYGKKC